MRTLSDKLLWGATYCNPLWNNTASYHSHPNLFGSDDGVASEVLNKSHFSTHHFMKWVRHINFSPRPRLLLWLELWLIRNELFPAGWFRSTCWLGLRGAHWEEHPGIPSELGLHWNQFILADLVLERAWAGLSSSRVREYAASIEKRPVSCLLL